MSQDNCLIPKDRHKYYCAGEPRNEWELKRGDAESWCFMLLLFRHYVKLIATSWTASHQALSSFTISQSLLKPTSIESMMPSNHLILSSSCPQSFPALRTFPSSGQSIGASASVISLSNEYSGFISFQIDWFVLPAVQGTLKSFLQHHSSKASIIWHSAFFIISNIL